LSNDATNNIERVNRSKNSKRNAIYGFVCKSIQLLLPFILRYVIINNLGIEYLGVNGFCTSVLQVLNAIDLGFSEAVLFNLYKPLAEKDSIKVKAIMHYYHRVYMIMGTMVFLLGICIIPFTNKMIKGDVPLGVNIYIAFFVYLINSTISYFGGAYKALLLYAGQRNDLNTIATTIAKLVVEIAQIIFIIKTRNYYSYLFLLPVATILYNASVSQITKKKYPEYIGKEKINSNMRKEMRVNIFAIAIDRIKTVSRNSFDSIVISSFLGLSIVGIYNNYFYILTGVLTLTYVLSTSITASIGDSIAIESVEKNFYDFQRINFLYMWVTVVSAACFLCTIQPFMEIWMGKEYLFEFRTAVLFVIYYYSLQMCEVFMIYFKGAGLWKHRLYRGVVASGLNVILNIFLGYYWGVNGIVLATILSVVLIDYFYTSKLLFKYYFSSEKYYNYIKSSIMILISAILDISLTYMISSILAENIVIKLLACVVISFSIWILILGKTRIFHESVKFALVRIRRNG